MRSKEGVPSAIEITDQCLIAFGAGAGTANVTPSALRAIRSRYFKPVTSLASAWDEDGEVVLRNARELGRICAELAAKAGRPTIGVQQFRQAIGELRKLWKTGILPNCPCHE
jgi:hypothetical protein